MRERERERERQGDREEEEESHHSRDLTPYPENTAPSGKCRDAQGAWGSTLGTCSDSQPRESSHGKFLVLDLGFGVGLVRVLGLELAPTINQWVNHPKVRSRFCTHHQSMGESSQGAFPVFVFGWLGIFLDAAS